MRTLEAELARVRSEAIPDYKASQEFEDLLNVDYHANFPETFKSFWENIIGELGSQIKGVTLERFHVSHILGKLPSSQWLWRKCWMEIHM